MEDQQFPMFFVYSIDVLTSLVVAFVLRQVRHSDSKIRLTPCPMNHLRPTSIRKCSAFSLRLHLSRGGYNNGQSFEPEWPQCCLHDELLTRQDLLLTFLHTTQ